jgi:hypothetical protein
LIGREHNEWFDSRERLLSQQLRMHQRRG